MEASTNPTTPQASQSSTAASFTVTKQELRETYNPGGPPTEYWRVHFQTAQGVESYVDVLRQDYTPDIVAAQIRGEVEKITGVHNLS